MFKHNRKEVLVRRDQGMQLEFSHPDQPPWVRLGESWLLSGVSIQARVELQATERMGIDFSLSPHKGLCRYCQGFWGQDGKHLAVERTGRRVLTPSSALCKEPWGQGDILTP